MGKCCQKNYRKVSTKGFVLFSPQTSFAVLGAEGLVLTHRLSKAPDDRREAKLGQNPNTIM